MSEIIRGKKRITAETALDFAEALGIEAEFWLNLQVNYELDQARSRRRDRLMRSERRQVVAKKVAGQLLPVRRSRLAFAAKKAFGRAVAKA